MVSRIIFYIVNRHFQLNFYYKLPLYHCGQIHNLNYLKIKLKKEIQSLVYHRNGYMNSLFNYLKFLKSEQGKDYNHNIYFLDFHRGMINDDVMNN